MAFSSVPVLNSTIIYRYRYLFYNYCVDTGTWLFGFWGLEGFECYTLFHTLNCQLIFLEKCRETQELVGGKKNLLFNCSLTKEIQLIDWLIDWFDVAGLADLWQNGGLDQGEQSDQNCASRFPPSAPICGEAGENTQIRYQGMLSIILLHNYIFLAWSSSIFGGKFLLCVPIM
jgi:hypothetical protein